MSPRDFKPRPQPRPLAPTPSVYVIATDSGNTLCKIGVSCDPEGRLKQLQTGCPYKLRIVYVCILKDRAFEVESFAHMLLSRQAVGGEWFSCSENQAIDAVNRAAASFGKRISDISPKKTRPPVLYILIVCLLAMWILMMILPHIKP